MQHSTKVVGCCNVSTMSTLEGCVCAGKWDIECLSLLRSIATVTVQWHGTCAWEVSSCIGPGGTVLSRNSLRTAALTEHWVLEASTWRGWTAAMCRAQLCCLRLVQAAECFSCIHGVSTKTSLLAADSPNKHCWPSYCMNYHTIKPLVE